MMSWKQLKSECAEAFKQGNKLDAEQLLPQIRQPADIKTTTKNAPDVWYARLVSLLHLAAHHGWVDIIIDLITKYKCDANCKDFEERTPLHYATSNNHLEVVRYFIKEQHCDPMTRENYGWTPLHYTCRNGHFNIVQYLINEAHCKPSCKNNNGDTPLHYACEHGHVNIVQYLLSTCKVNPLAKNKNGEIPMYKLNNYNKSTNLRSVMAWRW